ncbi:hypothetical protein KVR01_003232 [Diaporthe batatas]|uniref:uncharacterized protein n=1 Tax=Diaporthe batatas TaxID=748121 RepID=UPI001D03F75C|nr:uncharacterized protein KVR01_003232 [Diaporthe batatas]KAG8167543.1 hypothetical protein KVR01_003232 [Diaporthe batatas]
MSCSPSKARSLPALRPDQSSPAAALKGRPTALQLPHSQSDLRVSYGFRLQGKTETQISRSSTPSGYHSHYLPVTAVTKHAEAAASGQAGDTRPPKIPKLRSLWPKDDAETLDSSKIQYPLATSGPNPPTGQPFFSLSEEELKQLRRKMGKGPGYKSFRYLTVAKSLKDLGRGWEGFLRAKDKAEKDNTINQFWHNFSSELNTILSTTRFPVGALSLEIAASAAQSNYTESTGSLQPEYKAEIQRLKTKFRPSVLPSWSSGDSTVAHVPPFSTLAPEWKPQLFQQERPDPVSNSRPKRILERPNYRELPLLESSPEPRFSPELSPLTTSPTPRELYDSIQPVFIQYPCEWNGCKAVLNNLETLRKHIHIVHWQAEEAEGTLCCCWGSCGTGSLRVFKSIKDLENHSAAAHLTPLQLFPNWDRVLLSAQEAD